MTDPLSVLGAVSGSIDIIKFAIKSTKTLYELIKSFHDYPETVEHLRIEIYTLFVALQKVQELSLDDTVLAELEPILKACSKACCGLREVIDKCTSRSGGRQPGFLDWMKMTFLGGSISEFKETLAGYKGTIIIIISTISLDFGQTTLRQLAEYQSEILKINSRLSTQLKNLGQRSLVQVEDQEEIKEVERVIIRCIQACEKVGNNIDRVRLESLDEFPTTSGPEKSVTARRIRQNTNKIMTDIQKSLSKHASQLQEVREQQRSQQQERVYYENSIQYCLSLLAKKAEQSASFENISCSDDAIQIITSTSGKPIAAKDVDVKGNGSQILGDHSSETIDKLIENHTSRQRGRPLVPHRKFLGFIPMATRKESSSS